MRPINFAATWHCSNATNWPGLEGAKVWEIHGMAWDGLGYWVYRNPSLSGQSVSPHVPRVVWRLIAVMCRYAALNTPSQLNVCFRNAALHSWLSTLHSTTLHSPLSPLHSPLSRQRQRKCSSLPVGLTRPETDALCTSKKKSSSFKYFQKYGESMEWA